MRWHVPFFFALLIGPGLAGCLDPDDPAVSISEGYGLVKLQVQRPLEIEKHPNLWSLQVAPRLVLFMAADNDTRMALNDAGYVAVADGWPAGWGSGNHSRAYPESALQDWMRPSGVWFEGEVPAGNYSFIRIEFVHLAGKHLNGRDVTVRAVGDRLSVGAPEGATFTVREGQTSTFVLNSMIIREHEYHYEIR